MSFTAKGRSPDAKTAGAGFAVATRHTPREGLHLIPTVLAWGPPGVERKILQHPLVNCTQIP
jgi:hypothetical protein